MLTDDILYLSSGISLDKIDSRIYGYCLRHGSFLKNARIDKDIFKKIIDIDTVGCFTIVLNEVDRIIIYSGVSSRQNVFYYKSGKNWVVSNSFYLMTLNIKSSLTIDRPYLDLFSSLNSIVPSCEKHTPFNEIRIVSTNQLIIIDKNTGILSIEPKPHINTLVSLNTEAGFLLLDHWAYKWKSIYSTLDDYNQLINVQLSGGFDSRCSFALISDVIDQSKSSFNLDSSKGMHDDYVIAEKIAKFFGIDINKNRSSFKSQPLNSELVWFIQNAFRFGFNHEILSDIGNYYNKPKFTISGHGAAHSWYTDTTDKYILRMILGRDPTLVPDISSNQFNKNISSILNETFHDIDNYYDYQLNHSKNFLNFHFMYGRSKYTDGTSMSIRSCFNEYILSPFMDSEYFKFNPIFTENTDYNLIPAIILTRYCDKLLDFDFANNHSIDKSTLMLARELNNKFPKSKYLDITSYDFNYVDDTHYSSLNISPSFDYDFSVDKMLTDYLTNINLDGVDNALSQIKQGGRHNNRLAYTYYQILHILKISKNHIVNQ